MRFLPYVLSSMVFVLIVLMPQGARAETTFFPVGSFGVAGPIPTPGNFSDLVGSPPDPATAVRFDPGDLGFLLFDTAIVSNSSGAADARLLFNVISSLPSASGDNFISVLLGNIANNAAGTLVFTIATTPGLTTPDGGGSIFQFTQVNGTGIFSVSTDVFVPGCQAIGGCNTIVIGTSGLGAAGGGSFIDGGTLTFSSVVASSPEPAVWLMMILGFAALARRAKVERKNAAGLTQIVKRKMPRDSVPIRNIFGSRWQPVT